MSKPKFELCPQEAIKFNEMIIDFLIVKVAKIKEFLITDESCLTDFFLFIETRGSQTAAGSWEFKARRLDLPVMEQALGHTDLSRLSLKERKQYQKEVVTVIDDEDVTKFKDLQSEIENVFKVTLTSEVLRQPLVKVAFEISKNLSPEMRNKLTHEYPTLFN